MCMFMRRVYHFVVYEWYLYEIVEIVCYSFRVSSSYTGFIVPVVFGITSC